MKYIAITSGEPAGVGPEVTLKATAELLSNGYRDESSEQQSPTSHAWQPIILGDFDWLSSINQRLGSPLELLKATAFDNIQPATIDDGNNHRKAWVLHTPVYTTPVLGQLNSSNADYVMQLLETGHQLAIKNQVDALVTAPVHKGILSRPEQTFTGHTEYFAAQSNVERVVMMLASDVMRVALFTTHLPLREVADQISEEVINQTLSIAIRGLQQLGIQQPKIKVLGLNPHAGEQGHLGLEELQIIEPSLASFAQVLSKNDAEVLGPYPADTVFSKSNLASTDLFLGMYHDQVLPVIKYASFGECANVTLGLPYLRTSVDHGTALDIADSLSASNSSMLYAIRFALAGVK